jgi:hypothetical protein
MHLFVTGPIAHQLLPIAGGAPVHPAISLLNKVALNPQPLPPGPPDPDLQ